MIAAKGDPRVAAAILAAPAKAKEVCPGVTKSKSHSAPSIDPIKRAGAKTPPKNPKLKQIGVTKIFAKIKAIIKLIDKPPDIASATVSDPAPRTCGNTGEIKKSKDAGIIG